MNFRKILNTLQLSTTGHVKTPMILQMESSECGAAALAIIMAHYQKIVPLEEIRVACGVSRDGINAGHIIEAAKQYGFESQGIRLSLSEVMDLPPPFIVFWHFNHFVVVEGFAKNGVYLNDPANGHRIVTYDEFDHGFTGVVIEVSPGPNFRSSGTPPSLIKSLIKRLPGSYAAIVFLILVGLALVIPGLLVPVFTKVFVDEYLVGKLHSWIMPLLIGMGITAVVRGLLRGLESFCLTKMKIKISTNSSSRFLWHILRLPLSFYSQRSAGDISNRISINDRVAETIAHNVAGTFISTLTIVFYAALMFYYSYILTIIAVGIAIINILILKFTANMRKSDSFREISMAGKFIGTSMNGLVIMESLKATGRENDFFAKWAGQHANLANLMQSIAVKSLGISTITLAINSLGTVAILVLGALQIMNGTITIGMLVAFQSLMVSFLTPINKLVNMGAQIQELNGDMMKLNDINLHKQDHIYRNKPSQIETLSGEVEIKNLSFGYSKFSPAVIDNFNLTIKPGSRVAIVGPSGCGKSTVAKLIMQLYQPWKGEILMDGRPIGDIDRESLKSAINMVSQDIFIFSGTVKDNLTMWDDTVTQESILSAAKDACIHSDICSRDHAYDAILEEGGKNFSGGQRQRLEIARSFIYSPKIIIMDEATSALDPLTELTIDDNIRRRGCSAIIIAHRLSTIRDCDEIIVLNKGQIAQRGIHDDLIKQSGIYANLVRTM